MRIIKSAKELSSAIATEKYLNNRTIGFVPTMGALHQGHLALVQKSISENELTVVSIFVNPTQFNDPEDFKKYPNTIDEDLALLLEIGCDMVFLPSVGEMYPQQPLIKMNFGYLDTILEAEFRPGHFSGVAQIVSKLLHLAMPHKAYFGQKDLQQCVIIQYLIQEFGFPVEMIICDTCRDEFGLALSSRNKRLSEAGLLEARKLNQLLAQVILEVNKNKSLQVLEEIQSQFAQANPLIEIEYLRLVDAQTLKPVAHYQNQQKLALCIAAFVEGVRLIDNLIFECNQA